MLAADGMTDNDLALMAVAVYAMHRATAHYRKLSTPSSEQVRDFLQATCQSAVRGHRKSLQILDEAVRLRRIPTDARRSNRSRSPRRLVVQHVSPHLLYLAWPCIRCAFSIEVGWIPPKPPWLSVSEFLGAAGRQGP